MKLSVVIPVFNELATVDEILRQVRAVDLEKEIIVVDDCSTDGTRDVLRKMADRGEIRLFLLADNRGKGGAVREGLRHIEGDIVVIQDADLEYDPAEYSLLLRPILNGRSKAVYGSRFIGEHKAMYFWHGVGNRLLTLVTNILFDSTLSDMETCYKMFTVDIARKLDLHEKGWGFDPEITAKILRMGHRIYEVPISYAGREYNEGKKITWRDALTVIVALFRYRFLP